MEKLISPFFYEDRNELSTKRSETIVNYIVILLAFAKENGISEDDLINWLHNKYEEMGYYDQWRIMNSNSVEEFVKLFIKGRNLLYDNIQLDEDDEKYIIRTKTWYTKAPSEAFFFFGIEPEELAIYSTKLAIENAKKLGFHINVYKKSDIEEAHIYKTNGC